MKFIRGTLIFISKENSKMSLPSNEGKSEDERYGYG